MSEIGAYEAKTRFAELLERVRRGERVTITRHGHPVAELSPVGRPSSEQRLAAMERMRAFRRKHPRGKMKIRELIDEGRRT